jgi:hypothetical protein
MQKQKARPVPSQRLWFGGFANIALIIILVLIAGGVGYYFAKQGAKDKGLRVEQTVQQETADTATQKEILVVATEEDESEIFQNQPGEVKSITNTGVNEWVLEVDLLTHNPNFLPGINDFFMNQNSKIRNLNVNSSTQTYFCGAGPDNNDTTADIIQNTSNFIQYVQNMLNEGVKYYYFDISGTEITAIYQQCLP